jgi:hypothetical protein
MLWYLVHLHKQDISLQSSCQTSTCFCNSEFASITNTCVAAANFGTGSGVLQCMSWSVKQQEPRNHCRYTWLPVSGDSDLEMIPPYQPPGVVRRQVTPVADRKGHILDLISLTPNLTSPSTQVRCVTCSVNCSETVFILDLTQLCPVSVRDAERLSSQRATETLQWCGASEHTGQHGGAAGTVFWPVYRFVSPCCRDWDLAMLLYWLLRCAVCRGHWSAGGSCAGEKSHRPGGRVVTSLLGEVPFTAHEPVCPWGARSRASAHRKPTTVSVTHTSAFVWSNIEGVSDDSTTDFVHLHIFCFYWITCKICSYYEEQLIIFHY